MRKPATNGPAGKPAGRNACGPGQDLRAQFDRLERMIDEAVAVIGRLRTENRELVQRLAESERRQHKAVRRLDGLLEGIERFDCVTAGPNTEESP